MTFYIYKDRAEEYRWKLKSNNGKITADSGEGYVAKQGVKYAIDFIQKYASSAKIVDLTIPRA